MSPNLPHTGFRSAKIFPGGGQVPWKWATMWSFQISAVLRRTESGAWTTGVPSSRKVGLEIFLRFLSEDLSLWAYEGPEESEVEARAEEDWSFTSRAVFDKRTSLEEKDFPSGSNDGGSSVGVDDCGSMESAGEEFLDHQREVSGRRDSEKTLIAFCVAREKPAFFVFVSWAPICQNFQTDCMISPWLKNLKHGQISQQS